MIETLERLFWNALATGATVEINALMEHARGISPRTAVTVAGMFLPAKFDAAGQATEPLGEEQRLKLLEAGNKLWSAILMTVPPTENKLWIWYWQGGGYNSCRAKTREEALAHAAAVASKYSNLKVDESSLHVGSSKELAGLDRAYS